MLLATAFSAAVAFYRFVPSGLVAEERRYLDSLTPMAQLGALNGPRRRAGRSPS